MVTLALTALGDWRCWGSNDRAGRDRIEHKEVEQALLKKLGGGKRQVEGWRVILVKGQL